MKLAKNCYLTLQVIDVLLIMFYVDAFAQSIYFKRNVYTYGDKHVKFSIDIGFRVNWFILFKLV